MMKCRAKQMGSSMRVAVAVLLLLVRIADAQPVSASGEGCIEATPSAPTDLKVVEKSKTLIINWGPPKGDACIDLFLIDIFLPGEDQPIRSSSTSSLGNKHTVEGLNNDQEYSVRVQAYSSKKGSGPPATRKATPNTECADVKPDKIKNLRVAPDDNMVDLCWDGVENNACVDRYEISFEKVNKDRSSNFRSSSTNTVEELGCKAISRLDNNQEYKFEVIAISSKHGKSNVARTTAIVGSSGGIRQMNGWTCKRFTGCQPDVTSPCSLFGCQTASRLGLCGAWQMYSLDYFNREIDQWCAEECGCDTSVPLTWMPGRFGALNGLTDSLDLSNIVQTFTSALQLSESGGSNSGSGGNILEEAQKALSEGASETQDVLREAIQEAVADAREEGSLLGGGVVQNVLQQTAESGVIGEAAGEFISDAISNVVKQGINNVVNSWAGAVSQLFTRN